MRILFVPPISFPIEIGGFQSQVRHIYTELNKLCVEVNWYNLIETNINDYDIIHFHSSVPYYLPIAKKAKDLNKKIVITPMIGSPYTSDRSYTNKLRMAKIPGMFYPIKKISECYNLADFFIPLTHFEQVRLNTVFKVPIEKTQIAPNGIDDAFFSHEDVNIQIPYDNYMLVVGRIEPDKNQLPLIKVANRLGINLVIVGETGAGQTKYYEDCKNNSGKNVFFWGKELNVSNMRTLYKKAALTVIPSVTEMLPLVIFESLSQKTPVLCTNHCGLYPISYQGLYYTTPNEKDLLKNVAAIYCQMPITGIGNDGVLSWHDVAVIYHDVYKKLLKK